MTNSSSHAKSPTSGSTLARKSKGTLPHWTRRLLGKGSYCNVSATEPLHTQIHLNELPRHLGKSLLCVTHSDRPTELDKCNLNYLEGRFSEPNRLPPATSFEELQPSSNFTPHLGEISLYDLDDNRSDARLVCHFRPAAFKPQHAVWHGGFLWVLGVVHIDVYDCNLRPVDRIDDPWLAGGHTITFDDNDRLLVSCAASDSVLIVDALERRVTRALRLPESLYGSNYPLRRTDSVVDHFIPNDLQIGHVNCAWPWRQGILTSALIPGAIGWFDPSGAYHELLMGFVGCHGARVRSDTGEIYFSDSCTGAVIFLDAELRITRRIATGSMWLHDAVQIRGDLFALAVTDRNEVLFFDLASRTVVGSLSCEGKGGGPQFLSLSG